jgi:hypothetical protein
VFAFGMLFLDGEHANFARKQKCKYFVNIYPFSVKMKIIYGDKFTPSAVKIRPRVLRIGLY